METMGLGLRTFVVALALLAAAWVAWTFMPGMFPLLHKAEPRTITVQGAASLSVAPDKVEVSGAVTTSARSAAEALDQNNLIMARILEGLKEDGIGTDKIRTTGFSITPQHPPAGKDTYRDNELVVTGYVVKNSINVTLPVGQYSGKLLDRMIRLGATNIDGVAFVVSNTAKHEDEVRALAAKHARHRAEIAAKALGQRVGGVVSVDRIELPETVVVTGSRFRARSVVGGANAPSVELMAREQTFDATVAVVFELEPAAAP
jgi:uncharacterized protein